MTIAEQIIRKVQALSLQEQKRLLEILSGATSVQIAGVAGPNEVRNASVGIDDSAAGAKLIALAKLAEKLPTELPVDLAANHDHYLYGLPKRT